MRYVFIPSIFVLVGYADSAPTSTDQHVTSPAARPAGVTY